MSQTFYELLNENFLKKNVLVCIELDPIKIGSESTGDQVSYDFFVNHY